jgi:hypothetical protein
MGSADSWRINESITKAKNFLSDKQNSAYRTAKAIFIVISVTYNWKVKYFVIMQYKHFSMSIIVQQDWTTHISLYFCKLFYMFRVVTPPVIRRIYNCNYGIWHWSKCSCCLPLWWRGWNY